MKNNPNPPIENYESEAQRNRRKQQRRRAALLEIAKELGYESWSSVVTAVKNGELVISRKVRT